MLLLCNPQHKLIASIIQQTIQKVEAKKAARDNTTRRSSAADTNSGDSLGLVELLEGLTRTLFRILLYYVVQVETMMLSVLPSFIGWVLTVILCSWLYVLNSLFVRWEHYKWRATRALAEFRIRWLYYLGLGLPFSFLCNTFSITTNALLYCTLFPFFEIFVICAADGDKKGPYKSVPAKTSDSADKEPHQKPEPVIVPVFFCAEFIVNWIFDGLTRLKERFIAPPNGSDNASVHEKEN